MPPGIAEVGSAANDYEIVARLAVGGMAEIFLARTAGSAGIERYVVLKRVLRERASDVQFVRMFVDEARLAAQLQHPNIAQVYDLGRLGDSYFFTMEYVHGETVRAVMNRAHMQGRPVPIGAALTIVAGAAAGLHHAHERKDAAGRALDIVHRDVSPSNLMVSYEGAVKVVDFGVAKAAHRTHQTVTGAVKGKIAYLSPEQCRAQASIDRRSDLFSLGIVLWELLTLERLYRRASDFDQMFAIVEETPPAPSSRRADIPRELDALVQKLLAKRPEDRYQTADELHGALEQLAVRGGSVLSNASLGRFVTELFGHRPEPWVEMRHSERVTVTTDPVPADLDTPIGEPLDERLGAVPDLSAPTARVRLASDVLPTIRIEAVEPSDASVLPSPPAVAEPARRLPLAAIVLGGATAFGIVVAVLATSGGNQPVSARDAAAIVHEMPPAPPAPAPVPSPAPVTPDAPTIDAAPAPSPAMSPREVLATHYQSSEYSKAVAMCVADAALAAQNPTACIASACHLHDATHARLWLKTAGGKREAIVTVCAAAGLDLSPPRQRDCHADPLSCQH